MTGKRPYWEHPWFDPYNYPELSGVNQYDFFQGINSLNFSILRECHCLEEKSPCPRENFVYTFSDGSEELFNFVCFCSDPLCTGWQLANQASKILTIREHGFIDNGSGDYSSEVTLFKIRPDFYLFLYSCDVSPEPDFSDYYERNAPHLFEEKDPWVDLSDEERKRRYDEGDQRLRQELEGYERDFEQIPKGNFVDGMLVKATPDQLANKFIELITISFPNVLATLKMHVNMYDIPKTFKYDDQIDFEFNSEVDTIFSSSFRRGLETNS